MNNQESTGKQQSISKKNFQLILLPKATQFIIRTLLEGKKVNEKLG